MNLQQFHIIREAARYAFNLSDVALTLGISQPAVSRQVKELERELGVTLFQRHGKRLLGMTPVGEQMLRIINRMLDDVYAIRQLARHAHDTTPSGPITIGLPSSLACDPLPRVIQQFHGAFRHVQLTLAQGSDAHLHAQLQAGTIELLITSQPATLREQTQFFHCCSVPLQLMFPPDHPLLLIEAITLAHLSAFPLVTTPAGDPLRTRISDAFTQQGLLEQVGVATHDPALIRHYVEQGQGIGILPGLMDNSRHHVILRDASNLFPPLEIGVLVNSELASHPLIQPLIALCQSELRQFFVHQLLQATGRAF